MFNTPKKKAIALCILFGVIYCIHGFIGPAVSMYQAMQTGEFVRHGFLGWYHILTTVLVAAFYLPLAIRIRKLTTEANVRVLKGFFAFIVIALSAFTILSAICIPVGLLFPGLVG